MKKAETIFKQHQFKAYLFSTIVLPVGTYFLGRYYSDESDKEQKLAEDRELVRDNLQEILSQSKLITKSLSDHGQRLDQMEMKINQIDQNISANPLNVEVLGDNEHFIYPEEG